MAIDRSDCELQHCGPSKTSNTLLNVPPIAFASNRIRRAWAQHSLPEEETATCCCRSSASECWIDMITIDSVIVLLTLWSLKIKYKLIMAFEKTNQIYCFYISI